MAVDENNDDDNDNDCVDRVQWCSFVAFLYLGCLSLSESLLKCFQVRVVFVLLIYFKNKICLKFIRFFRNLIKYELIQWTNEYIFY